MYDSTLRMGAGAPGFVDALERACAHIGRHPAMGSPRYAHELDLPGLCVWPLTSCPHLVYYAERPGQIDVWQRAARPARHPGLAARPRRERLTGAARATRA